MSELRKTVLHARHVALGAKMVDFAGWDMPVQYPTGIVEEHLRTRAQAGLFDVSHMGRFTFRGAGALAFLQHVLTNNAAALEPGQAQYTIIPNDRGGAVDDAYLYRFVEDEYLLVVNASNRQKDWDHFQTHLANFPDVQMTDRSEELAMISLQGPTSRQILQGLVGEELQRIEPRRNALARVSIQGRPILLARTGYTGEPLCFELFVERVDALAIWDVLVEKGACPVGLGARDTLRLEAALPLYGHELGEDVEGKEIPIFAIGLAKFAVSFSPLKGEFVGRAALETQHRAFKEFLYGNHAHLTDLPRRVMPVAILDKAVARAGAKVFSTDGLRHVGYITSGTMVPYWIFHGEGLQAERTDEKALRPIALAMIDSNLRDGEPVAVEVRGQLQQAMVVPFHLRSEAPPLARAILPAEQRAPYGVTTSQAAAAQTYPDLARSLLDQAIANTAWRQRECVNLIPSEQTPSPIVRLLSEMDPSFRYAEHKAVKALGDVQVFYYQGVEFIHRVEGLLEAELRKYLGCSQVETRPISGQMANTIVFSAMVDYLNRGDRRSEAARIHRVMNHDIFRGGHLSAQSMGALKDFVARDLRTETPAVVNFPVRADNPFQIDLPACGALLERYQPELIILGRSLVLHAEPVAEIRRMVTDLGLKSVIMYDMAHVLGLVGPHFQHPFAEGADLVTGSTHKTFFGTQRGVVAGQFEMGSPRFELWEAITRRTFPGAVSNHHLGTMLGLLMAAYEMNHFRDAYQAATIANAKVFARALKDAGLDVAGDASIGYTQTHQVVVRVGYGRGPEVARRLEEGNIIVNYQAMPGTEGFSAADALRLGVAEMTRFGMGEAQFRQIAGLMADAILRKAPVADKVRALRKNFTELKYCFDPGQFAPLIQQLHSLI